jgi:hypothetical protein
MRNVHLEAAIWNLFTSVEFFEAAASECEDTMVWFGTLAVSRQAADFGKNHQIFETFKAVARDFKRGAELAKLGDYKPVWDTASSVNGTIRGIMEQPLHGWMTESEYKEFSRKKISRLLKYAGLIESALNNAIFGSESYFDPDPDYPEGSNDDSGFPGEDITSWHEDYACSENGPFLPKLPNPLHEYEVDRTLACDTGAEVPWTGVWYPATGLERHSLTFAIKGMRMQPVFKVIKTTEELRTDECMFPAPETVAVATTWHPVTPTGRTIETETNQELRAKAGQPCPKAGIWQPMEPGASSRYYGANEPMANLRSAYGITVWRWMSDR